MKIVPLAFDSMGTRSMATFVETKGANILIDPGVSLAPKRFRLPPHPVELDREAQHWEAIKAHARLANVLVVTHYHYDHHDPDETEIFRGKVVLIKHPREHINRSQRERAAHFLSRLKGVPREVSHCDGKSFSFGSTTVTFSQPVFHGTNARLGYVTQVCIKDESTFLHTSDVEGPAIDDQAQFILEHDPDVIACDGPMTYMLGYRYSHDNFHRSVANLNTIIQKTGVASLIIDHHLLRDLKWREKMEDVFEAGDKRGTKVLTAAEFAGLETDQLEARRKELYGT